MAPAQSVQMEFQRAFETGATFTVHLVNLRAADQRLDLARRDLQIDHRSIAHVGPAARQPIREVAVALEIVAPRLAPERLGDGAALDDDRRDWVPFLLELLHFARRLPPPLRTDT